MEKGGAERSETVLANTPHLPGDVKAGSRERPKTSL
jgi:hypothetical protein